MTSILSQSEDDGEVGLHFVLSPGCSPEDCGELMLRAFQLSSDQELCPEWRDEEYCLSKTPDKRNVFVFENFSGAPFEHLQQFKCVLIGPMCLISCLMDSKMVPYGGFPVFTCGMRDLVVSATGVGADKKKELKHKVELMAGVYTNNVTIRTTHLITTSVLSLKYEKTLGTAIQVMTPDWIEAVWRKSKVENINGSDEQFERFKCPAFYDLVVCCSNVPPKEVKKVQQLVEKHGGRYSPSLTASVKILVLRKPEGDKFKYAKQWDIACVSTKWIYDSVEQGRALATKTYEMVGTGSSTPTKERAQVSFSDMSIMSNINYDHRSHVDETLFNESNASLASFRVPKGAATPVKMAPPPSSSKTPVKTPVKNTASANPSQFKHLLNNLDPQKTKAAGTFLDGCGVYLSGWNSEQEEKLRRILKGSGAARFTELTESVTHILVGDLSKELTRSLRSSSLKPHAVSVKWLIQSVAEKCPASEEPFSCFETAPKAGVEPPSPLSKKGMALLQVSAASPDGKNSAKYDNSSAPSTSKRENNGFLKQYQDADQESKNSLDLAAMYLKPTGGLSNSATAMPPPPPNPRYNKGAPDINVSFASANGSIAHTPDSQLEVMIFEGLKFMTVGLSEESASYVENELIKAYGGEVVPKSFKGVPDYAVVPLPGVAMRHTTSNIVTILWLEDCVLEQQLVPVEEHHQPIVFDPFKKPLKGCVTGTSGYAGTKRKFVLELAAALGAVAQEVFAKKSKTGVLASTHLICASSEPSAKYNAAMKWGLPVVSHTWLLACASAGSLVPESSYLINPAQVISERRPSVETDTSSCDPQNLKSTPKPQHPNVAALKKPAIVCTPETPLRTDLAELDNRLNKPPLPKPYEVHTPNTPLGFSDEPTPGESKRIQRWLNKLPDRAPEPAPPKRRESTPLCELKKRVLKMHSVTTPEMLGQVPVDDNPDPEMKQAAKRQRLNDDENGHPDNVISASKENDCSTPKHHATSSARQLFKNVTDAPKSSPIDGQLDKLNKLIETPEPSDSRVSNPSSKRSALDLPGPSREEDAPLPDPGSQPYSIKWEDPVNVKRASREGIMSPSKMAVRNQADERDIRKRKSSETMDNPNPAKRISNEHVDKIKTESQYVFMLSNIANQDECIAIINKLNGTVLDGNSPRSLTTHLVLDKPVRSEKLLCSIASGKWILHTSFITESGKKGKFLKEDDFEWGNPNNKPLMSLLKKDNVEYTLALAAHRWRLKLSKSKESGAFAGMKAIIHTGPNRMGSFTRLITDGGGEVVPETRLSSATICLVDAGKIEVKLEPYVKAGVPCVQLMFLNDYLTSDPPPDVWTKVIGEYTRLRKEYETVE